MSTASRYPPNNFTNFDETRQVNTPRSLTACAMEGILPSSLVLAVSSPRRKSVVGRLDAEKQSLADEAREHERQQLLVAVRAKYKTVASNQVASAEALQTTGAAGRTAGHSTTPRGATTVAKGAEAAQYDASLNDEAMQVVADDISVAKRFLRLKKAVEAKRIAQQKLEVREANGVQRYESVQRNRAEEAAARSEKFESNLKRVLHSKEKQLEDWHAKHESRTEERKQRQETAEKQVTQLKLARKSRAGAKDGEAERLAAEKHRQKMLNNLESKIEAANQATQERKEMRRQDEEIAAFKVDLKRRQVEEERKRAARAQSFRQAQIREQEKQDALQEQEEAAARIREGKSRALVRDILAKQRDEVEQYIALHQDDSAIATPKWLEHRIKLVQQAKADSSNAVKKRVPAPPPPRNVPSFNSARGTQRKDDDWASSSSNADRLPAVPKAQFSMNSPRLSERQSFGKWMFE